MSAYYSTMMDSSNAAKQLATGARGAEVNTKNLTVTTKTTTAAMVGAKIATVAFQAALSFGLAIAIQAAISGLQYLIHYQEKQAEAAHNQAQKSQESADKAKEEANSLDELISKYKELKQSENYDSNTRDEIKKVQNEIVKLVGDQATNLDLVNGKLDDQLEKLKNISQENAKNNLSTYKAAAVDAMRDPLVSTEKRDGLGGITDVGSVYADAHQFSKKQIENIINMFVDAVNTYGDKKYKVNTDLFLDDISAGVNPKSRDEEIDFNGFNQNLSISMDDIPFNRRIETIDNVLTYIEDKLDNENDSDLYRKLSRYKAQIDTYIQERQNKLSQYALVDLMAGNYSNRKVDSLDSYKTLRQSIIDDLSNDSTIQEALKKGFINEEWIANQADNYLSGLSQFKTYNEQYLQEQKKSADNTGNAIDNTTEKVDRFKQLMEEKGTDKNPSFVEGIEKSVEQLQNLEDALVKFESGTLTDKEKTSLFKAFPQLTAYADNLGAGIRKLLGEMRGNVVSQFTEKIEEFKKAGATEEEISQLKAYERTILNIADSVDSVKNALDSMKSVFKDLDSVIKDYNENQYFSLESLEKLGQNGQRYLSYLSYENGQLKINEEAYKKLVLAQIDEIETKATLQATTDLQSLTDETTAKEYLAKVNIDLAQSQLSAAQAAFQYQLALKLAQGGSVAKAAQKVADNLNSLRNIFASARSQVDDYAAAMLGVTSATEKKAKASEKAKSALESEQRALEHSKKALEDEKKALEDTKSEYEKAQKAIEDLIKWTQNYIKQIKEDEVKALQDKKEKFDELIEKQKESLQAEKDLHDYEKSVGEKQDTLASNALKVSATSLDDSGAGKKAYKKAQEEYKKSQTDMEDFLYDHSIETREKALDQLKEDTDKSYDEQIKTIQDYLSNEVQLYRDACKMIDNDNGTLYGKLLNYCLTYTTTGKKEFDHMWSLAQTAMEKYNVASVGTMQFMDELKGRIYDVDDAIDAVSKNIETYESRISDVKTQLDNLKDAAIEAKNAIDAANSTPLKGDASKSPNSSDNGMRYIGRGYDAAKGQYYYKVSYRGRDYWSYVGDSSDTDRVRNLAALGISKEIAKYHSGFDTYGLSQVQHALGVNVKNIGHYASGTRSAKSGIAQINENGLETLMRKTPDGDFVIMNQDDKVYTKKQTDNLYDFISNPEKFLSEKGLSPLSQEELANLGLWGDSSQLGMINSAFGVGGLSGLIEKITGGSGVTSSSATTNNIAPVVNITIQGDATQSTVNALHAEAENIVQRARNAAHNDLIETVLKGRKWR